ncbi:MAG: Crp/Fnr family transcriptional regulator [Clostridia bacterium]|nr:Crp/Fnr family transcriptional regulator [Clostridia bacterium]
MQKRRDEFEILAESILFAGCEASLLEGLCVHPLCRLALYKSGQTVDCAGGALGVLIKGKIAVHAQKEGKKLLLNCHEKGAVFGFSSLFQEQPSPFCTEMRAKGSVQVLWIDEKLLLELIEQDSRIACNIIAYQASKIRFLNAKILSLTRPGAEERLYAHLCAMKRTPDGQIAAPVHMSEISARLNMSRASVYRALDRLIAEGKVEKSGNTLIIKTKNKESEPREPESGKEDLL